MNETALAIKELKKYRVLLTKQQRSTIKGQILSGDISGAMRGLNRILKSKGV